VGWWSDNAVRNQVVRLTETWGQRVLTEVACANDLTNQALTQEQQVVGFDSTLNRP
jgi:hypothetical protein